MNTTSNKSNYLKFKAMNTSKNNFISFLTSIILILTAWNLEAQNNKQTSKTATDSKIEVIQFHSEHRCKTCLKIEELTKETLKAFPEIKFYLINVDDKKNEKKAEQFEATGTALFLYNPKTGKKKDLTDFAFMNAGNKQKFIEGLNKEIQQFGN
ncbi:MAG: hypothetical protein KatS3mg035_0921 [Bacteroidia bacterium]|nr:MAG: hypothetical protein KatS3mg035_0921 [Bacteroidia bacterium]